MLIIKRVIHVESGKNRNSCEESKWKNQRHTLAWCKDSQVMKEHPSKGNDEAFDLDHNHEVQLVTSDKAPKKDNHEAQFIATKNHHDLPRGKR